MNDVTGNWIPPTDEDGNDVGKAVTPLLVANLRQRLLERRTRREDERDAISAVEARKRLLEMR